MLGSATRADEVKKWLESQGSIKECLYRGSSENTIYYVDKGIVKAVGKDHSVLFDIIGLPRWRAEKQNFYYYVNDQCQICCVKELQDVLDDNRYKIGNYFEHKEEAELYAEKIREIFKERREK